MDELRAKTTLFCAALALAIALSMVLRGRKPIYFVFAAFAGEVAMWWASQSLSSLFPAVWWGRATGVLTILLPLFAVQLFQAVLPTPESSSRKSLAAFATVASVPLIVLELSSWHRAPVAIGVVYTYVFGTLVAGLISLWRRGRRSPSKAVFDRVRFLVGVGAMATVFTMADFVSKLPPIGAVLSVVFLFVLSESLARPRLADLYDMVGRLLVATALAFLLAALFYIFVSYIGQYTTLYNAVLAAIVFIVLFDPLKTEVEKRIHQFFFRERFDLETSVLELRRQLAHTLELDEMTEIVLSGIEKSRRATGCAIYLRDQDGNGFDLAGAHGPPPPKRLEWLAIRPLVERTVRENAISLEEIQREPKKEDAPLLAAATATLGVLKNSVIIAIKDDTASDEKDQALALLCVSDDRVKDAFTPEELTLLSELGTPIGIAMANSRIYSRMKERDRLAALGAMAAGLAHEIKNPLGAIKGAAQLLEEGQLGDTSNSEFVGIILEEVDRLNRVVGSFLDYARPHAGNPIPLDVNAAVRRTVQILTSQAPDDIEITLDLAEDLPPAKIDPEKFRQVLINLMQNGIHAMDGRGTLTITTTLRARPRRLNHPNGPASERSVRLDDGSFVEVSVKDTGPGIAQQVLKNLFVPFFTTKTQGTGLGLAISQSIVQNVGGSIEVQTQSGTGTRFSILLPRASRTLHPDSLPDVSEAATSKPALA